MSSTESQLQPCGHPQSAVVSTDEGTGYCGACEGEALAGVEAATADRQPGQYEGQAFLSPMDDDRFNGIEPELPDRAVKPKDPMPERIDVAGELLDAVIAWHRATGKRRAAIRLHTACQHYLESVGE